jgi:von Willebrand factor A domain-containing protein 7
MPAHSAVRLIVVTCSLVFSICRVEAAQIHSTPNVSRSFGPDACGPADSSYIHMANETGGQPMFLQRSEATKAMHLMRETSRNNVEIILRATARLGGEDTFVVPVDSSVTRITFTLSLDTKGGALTLIRPSGGSVETGQDRVEDTMLNCGRIVTIEAPERGDWHAVVRGSGTFWLSAQAQSEIYFVTAQFVAVGGRPGHEGLFRISGEPLADHPATLQVNLSTRAVRSVEFQLVAEDGKVIQAIPMKRETDDPNDSEFFGTFELPRQPFRVAAVGTDLEGEAFERQFRTLFHAATVEVKSSPGIEDLPAGRTTAIAFTVRNVGDADTFRVTALDTKRFLARTEPAQLELSARQSGTFVVEMAVPQETAAGTEGELSVVVKGAAGSEAQNSAVAHFSVAAAASR